MKTAESKASPVLKWFLEPGHTAAEFRARHMMVTWVRGSFKDVHGTLEFDPANPDSMRIEAVIDARTCWTGEPARDRHLHSDDFLGCESYPEIRFRSTQAQQVGSSDYKVTGDLAIRGVTRPVVLDVHFLGTWRTPWWEDGVDKGPKTRAGFVAQTRIDRYDFGVNWNGDLPDGGLVVSREIDIVIDAEAIAITD
jgi:polyisoprenoid-binding protein YceI